MGKFVIEDTTLTNIADAIRTKTETTDQLTPAQMPAAISGITTGGVGTLVYLNTDGSHMDGYVKYSDTEVVAIGDWANSASMEWNTVCVAWKKKTTNSVWPINSYLTRWTAGHTYRVLFRIFSVGGTVEWGSNNIYVDSNFSTTHNLGPITSEPQLIDFTFTYGGPTNDYEPTIHIYPNHVDENISLFVTPILIIDEDKPKGICPTIY